MNIRRPSAEARLLLLRRLIAGLGVGLVLLLASASASASLHHWLHANGTDEAGDQCAVILFATGLTAAVAAIAVAAPGSVRLAFTAPAPLEIFLASPRYLRQPERGPPGC